VNLLESPLTTIANPLSKLLGVVMQVDDDLVHMVLPKLSQQVAKHRL
jgi:hypothetical protein